MDTLRLRVPDVYCDGWLPAIRLAVRQLPGTGAVAAPDDGVVSIEYDRSAVAVDAIQGALRTVGYESSVLPPQRWSRRAACPGPVPLLPVVSAGRCGLQGAASRPCGQRDDHEAGVMFRRLGRAPADRRSSTLGTRRLQSTGSRFISDPPGGLAATTCDQ